MKKTFVIIFTLFAITLTIGIFWSIRNNHRGVLSSTNSANIPEKYSWSIFDDSALGYTISFPKYNDNNPQVDHQNGETNRLSFQFTMNTGEAAYEESSLVILASPTDASSVVELVNSPVEPNSAEPAQDAPSALRYKTMSNGNINGVEYARLSGVWAADSLEEQVYFIHGHKVYQCIFPSAPKSLIPYWEMIQSIRFVD